MRACGRNEEVVIDVDGARIVVRVTEIIGGRQVRLGFTAPEHVKIMRSELMEPGAHEEER